MDDTHFDFSIKINLTLIFSTEFQYCYLLIMNDLSKNTILPTKKICIFIIKNLKIDIFKSKGLVFLSVFHVLLHEMTKCNKRQNIYPKADCV